MTHAPHEVHAGYDAGQVMFDGCTECAEHATRMDCGITALDPGRFATAWRRAAGWQRGQLAGSRVSDAEAPLLSVLWSVQIQLENIGWPLGELPRPDVAAQIVALLSGAGELS